MSDTIASTTAFVTLDMHIDWVMRIDVAFTYDACDEVLLREKMRATLWLHNGINGVWAWGKTT